MQHISKIILFFLISFFVFAQFALSDRSKRRSHPNDISITNPVKVKRSAKPDDTPFPYRLADRPYLLQIRAIQWFYAKDYEKSEESFSLAYRKYPSNRNLLLDYALCSLLYPERFKSLSRASALVQAEKDLGKARNPYSLIVESLIRLENNEQEEALGLLKQAQNIENSKFIEKLIVRARLMKKPYLSSQMANEILRERDNSFQEKRKGFWWNDR